MSLIHAFGTRPARTVVRHEDMQANGRRTSMRPRCLKGARPRRVPRQDPGAARGERDAPRSANEFAALAERLQRALVRERGRTARQDASGHGGNRRDGNHVLTISMQIEAEYRAIPNLRLTRWQAARLWDLEQGECDEAIAALVRRRVLRETPGRLHAPREIGRAGTAGHFAMAFEVTFSANPRMLVVARA